MSSSLSFLKKVHSREKNTNLAWGGGAVIRGAVGVGYSGWFIKEGGGGWTKLDQPLVQPTQLVHFLNCRRGKRREGPHQH